MPLPENAKIELLRIAQVSVEHYLRLKVPLQVDVEDYQQELQALRACFVTLRIHGQLRGCVGSLQAERALVADVAHNARAAAFSDPRFSQLTWHESRLLEFYIAVLTPLEPMEIHSEEELVVQLQPNRDGVVLREGASRSTLLPAAWRNVESPEEFVQLLKKKASLSADYCSDTISFLRYRTESFS